MGFRSPDPEDYGARLSENDAGDLAKLAADFVDQRSAGLAVRLTTFMANSKQGLDPGRSLSDKSP